MRVLPDGQAQPQAATKTSDGWRIAHAVTDLLPTRLSTTEAVGGGILAAGVVATLDRRRRTRQRLRKAGADEVVQPEFEAGQEVIRHALTCPNHAILPGEGGLPPLRFRITRIKDDHLLKGDQEQADDMTVVVVRLR